MKIKRLTIRPLEIPFKQIFAHSSATRAQTESILVTATSANGQEGVGEGCPRQYVTGETLESCQKFYENHRAKWTQFEEFEDIRAWVQDNKHDIDRNPAIWCAIELALLDLLGKERGKSLEEVVGVSELSRDFKYTAVLGTDSLTAYQKQLQQFVALGFKDYKIKITGAIEEDLKKTEMLKAANGEDVRIRLDANNLWKTAEEVINYLGKFDCSLLGIEEPIHVNDYDGGEQIYDTLGVPIILDESFLRFEQFRFLEDCPKTWIINIRISKMGGILRSLTIANTAKSLGIPIIIGAQVGETSILTRAALTVANSCRNNLLTQEGAFGTYLLEHDITDKPIMFGKEGILSAQSLSSGPGHGVDCSLL